MFASISPSVKAFIHIIARTMKILNVAEKNDAAKRIAEILANGNTSRREGFSKYNKIYEFSYDLLGQRNCKMTMTSVSGHLMGCEFASNYRNWKGCHPRDLFDADIIKMVSEDMINIKRTLERETRPCNVLIIWTDCDREGENIGYEIIEVCRSVKRNIDVYRAKFSEMTPGALRTACAHLIRPNQNISDAVDVRQEMDLRTGAAFTRFQTLRLQRVFPDMLADKLISYGPCQFPTLGFVVERFKACEAFVPEPFYKIQVEHSKDDTKVVFNWKRVRLFDKAACEMVRDEIVEPPCVAIVTSVTSKPKSKWRPVALDTVELLKLASRKLHITGAEAMKVAEKLYTKGFISYPRTETNIFPKDIGLNQIIEQQTSNGNWGEFAQNLLEIGPTPRNGTKTDNAHPPIYPLKPGNGLSDNEARLYELVTRHFLACCHRDAQGHETSVEVDMAGEKFHAQGLMIFAKNYLEVYIYEKWNAKVIPNFTMGEEFEPTKVSDVIEGTTTAPPLLSEADLLSLMDKHGIGTDATHAEHIETLKKRQYIGLTSDRRFTPGQLGIGLIDGYESMGKNLSGPNLRAAFENDLQMIANGRIDKDAILVKYRAMYKEVFEHACAEAIKLDEALSQYLGNALPVTNTSVLPVSEGESTVRQCPNCGRNMVLRQTQAGKYMVSCQGYPECRYAAFFPSTVLNAKVSRETCTYCGPGTVYKLDLKFDRRDIPPYMEPETTECVSGCSQDIVEYFGIRFKSSTNSQAPPSSRSSDPPRHLQQRNTNQNPRNQRTNNRINTQPRRINNNQNSIPNNNNSNIQRQPKCRCNLEAVKRTVQKDGPNKGRQFFTCEKPREHQCGFFEWSDAIVITNPNSTRNTANSTQSNQSQPRRRRPATCGLCGESGHTRRSCPQR